VLTGVTGLAAGRPVQVRLADGRLHADITRIEELPTDGDEEV